MLHLSYTQYIFLPLDQNAIKLSFSTLELEKKVTLFDVAVRQSSRCLWFKDVQSDNFGLNQILYCQLLLAKLVEHQLRTGSGFFQHINFRPPLELKISPQEDAGMKHAAAE